MNPAIVCLQNYICIYKKNTVKSSFLERYIFFIQHQQDVF